MKFNSLILNTNCISLERKVKYTAMFPQLLITIFVVLVSIGCSNTGSSNTRSVDSDTSSTPTDTIDITHQIFTSTSGSCSDYVNTYESTVSDIQNQLTFQGSIKISLDNQLCKFVSNAIPNHHFNAAPAAFATNVSEQSQTYYVTTLPVIASSVTELSLNMDNAIFLNGVKLDLLAAGCYGVRDGKIGCNDMSTAWRYDPMSPLTSFGTDSHNAHTQPDGTYHYHGDPNDNNPNTLYEDNANIESPVIGFAADGFPIYGPYFKDDNGNIQKAKSGYTLKVGTRSSLAATKTEFSLPPGEYDGQFIDDYEFTSAGNLDKCNGRTNSNGQYGYHITDSYPWVIGCFMGTPNSSFNK